MYIDMGNFFKNKMKNVKGEDNDKAEVILQLGKCSSSYFFIPWYLYQKWQFAKNIGRFRIPCVADSDPDSADS